jgi:hypothetical protein
LTNRWDCVPLPDPGAPNRTIRMIFCVVETALPYLWAAPSSNHR